MEELALALGRKGRAVRLGERPIHVPLDVRDRGVRQDVGQNAEEVVDDVWARHVEDELVPAHRSRSARDADGPVGVRLEQAAPLRDHLGLDPDAELETERFDLRREPADPTEPVR